MAYRYYRAGNRLIPVPEDDTAAIAQAEALGLELAPEEEGRKRRLRAEYRNSPAAAAALGALQVPTVGLGAGILEKAGVLEAGTTEAIAEQNPFIFYGTDIVGSLFGPMALKGAAKGLSYAGKILDDAGVVGGKIVKGVGETAEKGAEQYLRMAPDVQLSEFGNRLQNNIAQKIIAKSSPDATTAESLSGLITPLAARGAVEGTVYGTTYGINEELITNPDATAGEIMSSALTGALEGAVLGPLFSLAVSGGLGATALTAKKSVDVAKAIYGDLIDKHGDSFAGAISKIFIHGGDEIRQKFQTVFSKITKGELRLSEYTQRVADIETLGQKLREVSQRYQLEDQILAAEGKAVGTQRRQVQSAVSEVRRKGRAEQKNAEKISNERISTLRASLDALRASTDDQVFSYQQKQYATIEEKRNLEFELDQQIQGEKDLLQQIVDVGKEDLFNLRTLAKYNAQDKKATRGAMAGDVQEAKLGFADRVTDIDEFYKKEIERIDAEILAVTRQFQSLQAGNAAQLAANKDRLAKELTSLKDDLTDAKLSYATQIVTSKLDEQDFLALNQAQKDNYIDRLDNIMQDFGQTREMRDRVAERLAEIQSFQKFELADTNTKFERELKELSNSLQQSEKIEAKQVAEVKDAVNKESDKLNGELQDDLSAMEDSAQAVYKALGLPFIDETNVFNLNFSANEVENNLFGRLISQAFLKSGKTNNEIKEILQAVEDAFVKAEDGLFELGQSSQYRGPYNALGGTSVALREGHPKKEVPLLNADGDPVYDKDGSPLTTMVPSEDSLTERIATFVLQPRRTAAGGLEDVADEKVSKRTAVEAASIFMGLSKLLSELDTQYRTMGPEIQGMGQSYAVQLKSDIRKILSDKTKLGFVAELDGFRRDLSRIVKYDKNFFKKPNLDKAEALSKLAQDTGQTIQSLGKALENAPPAFRNTEVFKEYLTVLQGVGRLQSKSDDVVQKISMAADYRTVLDEFNHFMKYQFYATDEVFPQLEKLTAVRPSAQVDALAKRLADTHTNVLKYGEEERLKKIELEQGREAALTSARVSDAARKTIRRQIKDGAKSFAKFKENYSSFVKDADELGSDVFLAFARARDDAQDDLQTAIQGIRELSRNAKLSAREEEQLVYQAIKANRNAENELLAQLRRDVKSAKGIRRDAIGTARAAMNEEIAKISRLEQNALRELDEIDRLLVQEIGERQSKLQADRRRVEDTLRGLSNSKKALAREHKANLENIRRNIYETKRDASEVIREGNVEIVELKKQLLSALESIEQDTSRQIKPLLERFDELQSAARNIDADRLALAQGKSQELAGLRGSAVDEDIRDLLAYRQRDRFGSVANAFGLEALTNAMGSLIPAPVAVGLYATFKLMDNPRDVLRIAAGVYGASKFTGEVIKNGADGMLNVLRGAQPDKYKNRRSILARSLGLTVRANVDPSSTLTDDEYEELVMGIEEKLADPSLIEQATEQAQGKLVGVEKLRDPISNKVVMATQVLSQAMPQIPDDAAFDKPDYTPTPEDKTKLRDAYFAVADPIGAYFYLASKNQLSPQFMSSIMQVYPELTARLLDETVESLQDETVPYDTQISLSLATQSPLTSTMDPSFVGALQANISQPPAGQEQPSGVKFRQGAGRVLADAHMTQTDSLLTV